MRRDTLAVKGSDASEGGAARRSGPLRVIVAEDEPDIRELVAFGLREAGYEVVEASSGEELLDALGDTLLFGGRKNLPDVIISDIRMPGFTGLEVLGGLRNAEWPTAVVLMTAFADPATRAEAIRLGDEAFFETPFDMDDLMTAVINIPYSRHKSRPH